MSSGEKICTTYGELAESLQERGILEGAKDPVRQIGKWAKQDGWPGKAGQPGKRNAKLPVKEIVSWLRKKNYIAANESDELAELQAELARTRLRRQLREELEAEGRLCDVNEVAAVNRQCIADSRHVMDAIPDEVLNVFPYKRPETDEEWATLRGMIHGLVAARIESACEQLEGVWIGDDEK